MLMRIERTNRKLARDTRRDVIGWGELDVLGPSTCVICSEFRGRPPFI